jgi:hypothetical protein
MGFGLTGDEAILIRDALVATNVFAEVRVEVDKESGALPHPPGS